MTNSMNNKITITPYKLLFNERVYTSRGSLDDHTVFYVTITDNNGNRGTGECAPLYGLSPEYGDGLESIVRKKAEEYNLHGDLSKIDFTNLSSVRFAFECAEMQMKNGGEKMFDTPFCKGEDGIRINGLVWMGEIDVMLRRAREKYDLGFRCLKFKIGSKDFNREMDLLKAMRAEFKDITIRVDANCAYTPDFYLNEVEPVLHSLNIHSIEQPVKVADVDGLTRCCAKSRVDIALDESLIGTKSEDEMAKLLDTIKPKYVILKPTLCGGISGANSWIKTAKERGIGYWATSALESNVGLLSIAQWSSTIGVNIPQGLGTGMIYSNNIEKGLFIEGEKLWWKGPHYNK